MAFWSCGFGLKDGVGNKILCAAKISDQLADHGTGGNPGIHGGIVQEARGNAAARIGTHGSHAQTNLRIERSTSLASEFARLQRLQLTNA